MTHSESQKRFKERNKDRWNEIRRKSYARHKDSRKAREKIYRDNNSERLSIRRRNYYLKNQTIITANQRIRNHTLIYKIHLWKRKKVWKLDLLIFILFYKQYADEMSFARLAYNLKGGQIKQLSPSVQRGRFTVGIKNIYGIE